MEKQKSIIVLHQKKEKANGESADGLMNMGDIRKGRDVYKRQVLEGPKTKFNPGRKSITDVLCPPPDTTSFSI